MGSQLRGLVAIVNLGIEEAVQRIAQQQKRVEDLKEAGLPTAEDKKVLDVMLAVGSAMRDIQLMMQKLMVGSPEH